MAIPAYAAGELHSLYVDYSTLPSENQVFGEFFGAEKLA